MKILTPGVVGIISAQITAMVGAGVTLTGVTFDVIDALANVIQASGAGTVVTPTFPTAAVALDMGVPVTTLATGESRAIRQARMTLACSDGTSFTATVDFIVRGDQALIVGVNSFGTYLELELIAFETYDLPSFWAASNAERVAALQSAREDLCKLSFVYEPFDVSAMNRIVDIPGGFGMSRPWLWEADDLATLPADFILALKRSQVIQASYLLGDSPEERARASGLMSKTIGESSEMFRPGIRPLQFPICRRALEALRGYTSVGTWRLGRG